MGYLFLERTVYGWVGWKRPKRRLRAFLQLGVRPSWARRYAYSRKGGWRIVNSQVMNEVVRSKNDLEDHFNEENRLRAGELR